MPKSALNTLMTNISMNCANIGPQVQPDANGRKRFTLLLKFPCAVCPFANATYACLSDDLFDSSNPLPQKYREISLLMLHDYLARFISDHHLKLIYRVLKISLPHDASLNA